MDEQEFNTEFGRRIKEVRVRSGLTQQELADEVSLSRTSITNIEQGNQSVSVWLLSRIAEALTMDAAELFPTSDVAHPNLPDDVPAKTAEVIRRLAAAR